MNPLERLLTVGQRVTLTIAGDQEARTGVISAVLSTPDGVPMLVVLAGNGGGMRGWNWPHVVSIRPADPPHPGLA